MLSGAKVQGILGWGFGVLGLGFYGLGFSGLPRPSRIVPCWLVYYNPVPKTMTDPEKELRKSPWVGARLGCC